MTEWGCTSNAQYPIYKYIVTYIAQFLLHGASAIPLPVAVTESQTGNLNCLITKIIWKNLQAGGKNSWIGCPTYMKQNYRMQGSSKADQGTVVVRRGPTSGVER
jgi:hypothetical protein